MSDMDKTRAELEARLTRIGETVTSLRLKAEQQRDKYDGATGSPLDAIERKRAAIQESLREAGAPEKRDWSAEIDKLSRHLDDLDASLRQALAYYK